MVKSTDVKEIERNRDVWRKNSDRGYVDMMFDDMLHILKKIEETVKDFDKRIKELEDKINKFKEI
jgi:hypothetical protein